MSVEILGVPQGFSLSFEQLAYKLLVECLADDVSDQPLFAIFSIQDILGIDRAYHVFGQTHSVTITCHRSHGCRCSVLTSYPPANRPPIPAVCGFGWVQGPWTVTRVSCLNLHDLSHTDRHNCDNHHHHHHNHHHGNDWDGRMTVGKDQPWPKRGPSSQGVLLPLSGCQVRVFSGLDLSTTDEPMVGQSPLAREGQQHWCYAVWPNGLLLHLRGRS